MLTEIETEKWDGCYESGRGDLFTRESNRHPAKMAVGLCFRIFDHGEKMGYWKKGDLVLDPMAGIFTTGIVGATLGYQVIGIELEQHFLDLAWQNIEFAEKKFHPQGRCIILPGDARDLSKCGLFQGAINSPPYADQAMGSAVCFKARKLYRDGKITEALAVLHEQEQHEIKMGWARAPRSDENLLNRLREDATVGYSGAVASPPYAECLGHGPDTHPERTHSPQPSNSYDAAVGSPPYADQQLTPDAHFRSAREPNRPEARNNGRRRYDAAINSPPYLMPEGGGKAIASMAHYLDPGLANRQYVPEQFSKDGAQIGNLRDPKGDIDAVLSSPPWEDQQRGGNPKSAWSDTTKASEIASQNSRQGPKNRHSASPEAIRAQMERDDLRVYGSSEGQIGNSNGETYLSAMLQVYRQLWLVLKPAGVVALVTKNPVKNKQIRRLDLDTIALMEKAGFELIEHKYAMLAETMQHGHLFGGQETRKRERKSFFKRLYEKKNPHLSVDFEDVLYFRKLDIGWRERHGAGENK